MSTFAVTVEKIESVSEHPNADKLEIVKLWGLDYTFVVGIGMFFEGQNVIFFPIDSVLPDEISKVFELKEKSIVKAVKLRGVVSQGLLAHVGEFHQYFSDYDYPDVGHDLTNTFGVTKYEPEAVITKSGDLVKLPDYVSHYDIENAERHARIVDLLASGKVVVTEKVEGSHWGCTYDSRDDSYHVFQRNYEILPVGDKIHTWHKAFEEGNFKDKLLNIVQHLGKKKVKFDVVTIRGEIVGPGIQKNYYKLPNHRVYVFEIEIDGVPIDAFDNGRVSFYDLIIDFDIVPVPLIIIPKANLIYWIGDSTLPERANGMSKINKSKMREGIVIRPMNEMYDEEFGRVFIKQKSPEYLAIGSES